MRLGLHSPLPGTIAPLALTPTLNGLGDVATDQQIAGVATAMATTTVGIMFALGTTVMGLSMAPPMGPLIAGAIVAVAAIAQLLIKEFSGCGQSCIVASNDANKYEPYLLQNLQAYMGSPIHYQSLQQAALNNFDTIWNALRQACSDPTLGQAGVRCISDRQSGACQWKASPGGWAKNSAGVWTYTPAGAAGSGTSCWNWFVGYRDPIANDPTVVPDPVPGVTDPTTGLPTGTTSTLSNVSLLIGSNPLPWLLGAGVAAYLLTEGGK